MGTSSERPWHRASHGAQHPQGYDFTERDTVETLHRQFEAMKLAYADGKKYITEPSCMTRTVEELLSDRYAEERRSLIGETAREPEAGDPRCGGTVYLSTADGEGNMVSYIQSNYNYFGSGIVIPGTGIALQDRGANFSLDENHDNWHRGNAPTIQSSPASLQKREEPLDPLASWEASCSRRAICKSSQIHSTSA